MKKITRKLLSLLLTAALLLSCTPVFYAEGTTEPDSAAVEETTAPVEETSEPTEAPVDPTEETAAATEPEATTEPAEPTQAEDVPEETADPTEETVEEPSEEEEATEEENPEEGPTELPYGFQGLPEDYVLSESELADKQVLLDKAVLDELLEMTPGIDYEADTMTIQAETRETAELYAAAYSAELVDYFPGTGLIRLTTATIAEAVEAGQDMELPLPAACPNYIIRLDPNENCDSGSMQNGISIQSMETPQRMDWDAWINEVFDNPDPALLYPAGRYGYNSWPSYNYQYMHDTMDTYSAWGVTMGEGVKVAVVDTGVMENHPDLAGKVTSYDVGFGTGDGVGHGTHVAGIIAASVNNGTGGAGIAPNAQIISIRVFSGSGSTSDYYVAKGIDQAVVAGADIINLSLGGAGYSTALKQSVERAVRLGVCVVAAMGNDGMNQMDYPAAFDGVIAVVSSDANNTRAQYSNYGPWADIAAPGSDIYSSTNDGSFGLKSGTSMATPAVAGAAALYKSVHRGATASQIEARMKATAVKGGKDLGVGIVDVGKMLSEKPTEPVIWALDENLNTYATSDDSSLNEVIPLEYSIGFATRTVDQNWFYVYTLDGKTPAVKNGTVVVGQVYDNSQPIQLAQFAGQTITVKVMQVNGMGMASAVLTRKIQVSTTWNITGIQITGPERVVAGKKGEFQAVVYPTDKASQGVSWTIRSSTASGVSINAKTGVVTTKTTSDGTVRIRATSLTNPDKYAEFVFSVKPVYPVKNVTLTESKQSMPAGGVIYLSVYTVTNTNNELVRAEDLEWTWTSSNPKVATVDQNGVVQAISKGSATITCKVLDGSGKSAKCAITVTQLVENVSVTGQQALAPGCSATYKAAVYPANANNRSVTWSLIGAPAGTTISTSGKVTLPKNVIAGENAESDYFYVYAQANDGSGAADAYLVSIAKKCTGVTIYANGDPGRAPGLVYNKRGDLTGVGLFNVDLKNEEGLDNAVSLYAWAQGGYNVPIVWTSSNPAVASVSDGQVTAHKAGSATITAAAQDGSGKKASVSVKVTIPVSSMTLTSSADKGNLGLDIMAVGKTYSHTAVFGNLYGTPTNRKVQWGWSLTTEQNGSLIDVSEAAPNMVSCSGGKLTVKTGILPVLKYYGNLQVSVYAMSVDNTYVTTSRTYNLVSGATFVKFVNGVRQDSNGNYYLTFISDQAVGTDTLGNHYGDFVVTSSNSKIINPLAVESGSYNSYYGGVVHWLLIDPGAAGKATITVKTTDGTNKSAKFTVTVKP